MSRRFTVFVALAVICPMAACTSLMVDDSGRNQDTSISWPPPPQEARIRFLHSFSHPEELGIRPNALEKFIGAIVGKKDKGMVRPYAVAVRQSSILVSDPGKRAVHLFDTATSKYTVISKIGDGQLQSPVGVTLSMNRVFIADSVLGKVFVFDRKGNLLTAIDSLQRPTGLAYDANGDRLYVADTLAHQVVVYDESNRELSRIGTRGVGNAEFNFPSHIFIANGKLYVNDNMNFRVQTFDLDGQFLSVFGTHGDGSGTLSHPKGIAADSDGNVYVAGATIDRVQIFSAEGTFLLAFGRKGRANGEFLMPAGVAIADGRIYVADSLNQRIQVFQYVGGD